MADAIRIEHLDGGYPQRKVFHDLSLKITQGGFTALLGPNGSGKSTLLRFLYKELAPLSGSIHLMEKDISSISQEDVSRLVSLVPQNGRIDYDFSVMEAVQMGSQCEERALSALRECDLQDKACTSVRQLSGGEFQRVLIARALSRQRPILLLDEPVSSLDIIQQKAMLELFRRRAHSGTTVLCALHDLTLAQIFADHVVFLKQGKLMYEGPATEVCTQAHLEDVYGVGFEQVFHPSLGRYLYSPLWQDYTAKQ